MAEVGKPLLPWQREYCRDSLGRRVDGKWSSYESGLFVARQNGKGVCIEARELYSLFILRTHRIIHSAHLFDTSREAFERLMEIIDGSDWLTKRVARVNRAHGKEGIELTARAGGGALKYKARTLHGARGFSAEEIFLDEAYALVVGHMAAISPTLATLPNPAIGYFSSPPDDKTGPMPADAYLPSVRKRGLAGDPRMTYWEFSPAEGYDPADVEVRYGCNPSLGYLIQEEYLDDQFRIFLSAGKLENYSTEHLGAWAPDQDERWSVISEDQWTAAEDAASAPLDPIVFSISMNYERSHTCIGLAGARADGDLHVEVPPLDHRPGSGWVVARAKELNERWKPARWIVAGAAASLIPELEEALAVEVQKMTTADSAIAFGMLFDGLTRKPGELAADQAEGEEPRPVRRVWHRPSPTLATTMAGAKSRSSGAEGTTWESRDVSVDMSPVRAVTDALWGFLTLPPQVVSEAWVMYR
jgi:hypothetical protein